MKKIVVVTGANRGIGLAVSRQMADLGFHVIMTGRSSEKIQASLQEITAPGRSLAAYQLDVTSEPSIRHLQEVLKENYGRVDVLIHNAGIIGSSTSISNASMQEIREVMETNFFGPLLLTQKLLPLLSKSEDPRIINISSGMGAMDDLNGSYAAYRLSKAGLNNQTIMFSNALKSEKVKVYAMCPGWVKTDMGGTSAPLTPDEGADTAVWLSTALPPPPTGKFFRKRREIHY